MEGIPSTVRVLGGYNSGDVGSVIQQLDATVAWIPSQVPETYSYAASEMMRTGLPLVVSGFGALPERVAAYPSSIVVDWDAGDREWLMALLHANSLPNALDVLSGLSEPSAFYPDEYIAQINVALRARSVGE